MFSLANIIDNDMQTTMRLWSYIPNLEKTYPSPQLF